MSVSFYISVPLTLSLIRLQTTVPKREQKVGEREERREGEKQKRREGEQKMRGKEETYLPQRQAEVIVGSAHGCWNIIWFNFNH